MNPFNRNLVFAVSTILLSTEHSAVETQNMALVVLKDYFNRNRKRKLTSSGVCLAIFIRVKQKIQYIKQGSEFYSRKSVICRTATDKSNPYISDTVFVIFIVVERQFLLSWLRRNKFLD